MTADRPATSDAAAPSLIEYPVDFPIKVMGRQAPGLAQSIAETVRAHAPDFDAASIEMRASSRRSYVSLTCTIRATSREQLDGLYRALCDLPGVVMVL
ncbi:MAG: DUF493 domain-containing protein [Burkholderiales bacterium]|jgi:hypothetical protein|nr:DUF493 domain-containing protein [Burkholderiales bacterium]